jgi:hypothetical protein
MAGMLGQGDTRSGLFRSSALSRRRPRSSSYRSVLGCLIVGATLAAAVGCARADEPTVVIGTLPDGTRDELRVPAGYEIGGVEGVDGVAVWTDGPAPGRAIGITRFSRIDLLPPQTARDRVTVSNGRLVAPAGEWAMEVELYEHSMSRTAELEKIQAHETTG